MNRFHVETTFVQSQTKSEQTYKINRLFTLPQSPKLIDWWKDTCVQVFQTGLNGLKQIILKLILKQLRKGNHENHGGKNLYLPNIGNPFPLYEGLGLASLI